MNTELEYFVIITMIIIMNIMGMIIGVSLIGNVLEIYQESTHLITSRYKKTKLTMCSLFITLLVSGILFLCWGSFDVMLNGLPQ